ncbi:hypothetical protein [Paenibacillus ihumii]|uniref:hypothetical protein n=1 Tax=Paenibacillus ihumii TaxID=687436 RepID=UPI0006D857B9|nr:hypothetical protein [Paenibacillus ihumii]
MDLAEMLTFADIGQLSRIADHYRCECNGNSKRDLIQSILQTIGRREFIERHLDELSLEDLRFLNMLLFDGRRQFSLEELIACAQQSRFDQDAKDRESPRDMITRFRQRGWLFNGTTASTRYFFEVPEDLKRRFKVSLEARFKSATYKADAEPTVYREEHDLLPKDLRELLDYVYHHEIPLNAEGVMYRRNQMQLMEKLHISEPLVGKGWRFGYGRRFKDYPSRLALIYDYAYHMKWIREEGGLLILTANGSEFLAGNKQEPMIQFVSFWLRLYKGPVPNLLSLIYWIERCTGEWVTAASLYATLERLIKPFFYDTPESIFEERLLRMMLHLGMLRIGEGDAGVRLVQSTPFGRECVQQLQKH